MLRTIPAPRACALALACLCTFAACGDVDDADLADDVDLAERAPEAVAGIEEPVAGTYRLVRVADQPLPVLIAPEGECLRTLRTAMLTIGTDGQAYDLTGEVERECPDEEAAVEEIEEEGNYIIEGSTIHFGDDLEADEMLVQPHEGAGAAPSAFTFETFAGDGTIGEGDTLTVLQPGQWTLTFAPASAEARN